MADDNNDIKKDANVDETNLETSENTISPKEELEEISPEEKIKELEDTLLRTVAEMDNMRKRSEKERSEAYKLSLIHI